MPSVVLRVAAFLALASAALAPPARAEAPDYLAQQRFAAGRRLYDARDFEGALTAFRSSAALRPSPNTGLYIARSLRHLNRSAEAVAAYEAVLTAADGPAGPGQYEPARKAARQELAQVEALVARLSVRVPSPPPGLLVRLGSRVLSQPPPWLKLPTDPGSVALLAEAPGYGTVRTSLTLQAGQHREIDLVLERATPTIATTNAPGPLPPPRSTRRLTSAMRYGGWASAGAGAASLVASLIFWRKAQSRYDTLDERCSGGPCTANERAMIDDGRHYQTVTNVTLGVGLGFVGLGAALIVTSYVLGHSPAPAVSPDGVSLAWHFD